MNQAEKRLKKAQFVMTEIKPQTEEVTSNAGQRIP